MNRIARIEGRIENIKQRINSLAGGAAFNEHFKKAQSRLEQNITGKTGGISAATSEKTKNPLAELTIKMPKITYESGNSKPAAGAGAAKSQAAGISIKDTGMSAEIGSIIVEKSGKHQIDPLLISAIMAVESDFNPAVVSDKGAIGLMQLMPETASELGVNPYNVSQNVEGGTRYMKQMLDKFSGDLKLALAAYNAGPNAVIRHGGIPPYAETQNYVLKVLKNYESFLKTSSGRNAGEPLIPDDGAGSAADEKKAMQAVNASAAQMAGAVFDASSKSGGGGLFGSGQDDEDDEIYADEP
ncbi:MAG: hypothetical protein A2008_04670 [Candidatus Wallbacteria bacterium GWC2_49_35]|uniref:Transglycosylase SLT domain-containing protein n=1 Tax=Candidatus Wallbacteria bacterium GWC2_49_35 TaxID=1817813 RepID=A0A1F7WNC4_9BACT|nr:MAG: hypothetical protein A2008_04670 [Candidatus Wallbacteria bacterium GWC2_49_35]